MSDSEETTKLNKILKKRKFLQIAENAYDIDRLKKEIEVAEEKHQFLQKVICGWESIPLRSVGGIEGYEGNKGGGKNNSGDPEVYEDTTVMEHCPYIKEIVNSFNAPVLKVRVMRLIPRKKIHRHIDVFSDDNIIRLHIPIITNPKVFFEVDEKKQHLPENSLWWLNVRRLHKVENNGKDARIHIVFDIMRTPEFDKYLYNTIKSNY